MRPYLAASPYIDHDHPLVQEKAAELARGAAGPTAIVERCFHFVRDEIRHSGDDHRAGGPAALNPVTIEASAVLRHGTGFCYAKSHLLAALLRACGVPAGLCYQRLSVGEAGPPFCLHGLNAVHLEPHGWYRLDARGNKPGIAAAFSPPVERLAFPILGPEERDLPEIWPEPLPLVIEALRRAGTVAELSTCLPDILLLPSP